MIDFDLWNVWHREALDAGVDSKIADLGRQVIRDYWQHGYDRREEGGDGPFLGAPRHHKMMIALALQKPMLANAVFVDTLTADDPDEGKAAEDLYQTECYYGGVVGKVRPTLSLLDKDSDAKLKEWYRIVYALNDCTWNLYAGINDTK